MGAEAVTQAEAVTGAEVDVKRVLRRLVEVVGVKGHMDGFTMSRVWDRVP